MTSHDPLVEAAQRAAWMLLPAGGLPCVAKAPGRLDVLGGVADYSGGRVLEMPISAGVVVVAVEAADGRVIGHTTDGTCGRGVELTWDDLTSSSPVELGERLRADAGSAWAAYVLGPLSVLASDDGAWPEIGGLRFLVHSDLPVGAGLSSSAAVEIASLRALTAALDMQVDPDAFPRIAQRAEHDVAGAPCGLMDQVAVCHGEPGRLLPLVCRPMTREPTVEVPEGWRVAGIASGVRHSVAGTAYRRARAAAFMGRALLDDARARPWLAELPPEVLRADLAELPESLSGAAFLGMGGDHGDPLTSIEPNEEYPVRAAVAHAVFETERVGRFLAALEAEEIAAAGACLDESHGSYTHLGLGCEATDRLAEAAKDAGCLGARTSGGGSGGTVVVLLRDDGHADSILDRVMESCPGAQLV